MPYSTDVDICPYCGSKYACNCEESRYEDFGEVSGGNSRDEKTSEKVSSSNDFGYWRYIVVLIMIVIVIAALWLFL